MSLIHKRFDLLDSITTEILLFGRCISGAQFKFYFDYFIPFFLMRMKGKNKAKNMTGSNNNNYGTVNQNNSNNGIEMTNDGMCVLNFKV